jgi:hypothetical protein
MMRHFFRTIAVAAFFVTSLALPTSLAAQGAVSGAYGPQWQTGSKMESRAIAKLAKAQTQLAKAKANIIASTNKQSVASGTSITAGEDFRKLMGTVPTFATSADARAWAKKVGEGAKRWTASDKRGIKGGKALARATKSQKDAEADIVRAQSEIEQGRAIMADAKARASGT